MTIKLFEKVITFCPISLECHFLSAVQNISKTVIANCLKFSGFFLTVGTMISMKKLCLYQIKP